MERASKPARVVGWILSIIPAGMLLMSATFKFLMPAGAEKGFTDIGWPKEKALLLGVIEAGVTILFLIPQTAVLGAILVVGYLGGVIATHVRISDPPKSWIIPLALGVAAWIGLYLRDPRVRQLAPIRKNR